MIVMIVLFVLTAMVVAFAAKMKVEIKLARNDNNESQLEWEARGALEWAKYAITHKCPNMQGVDTLNEAWSDGISCENDPVKSMVDLRNIQFADIGVASVKITDMERKWNINMLANPRPPGPQPLIIQNALYVMGINDASATAEITDCILDWVTPTEAPRNPGSGAKSDYYLTRTPPYYCKNGYIDDISEMLLIKDVKPEMVSATNYSMSAYQMHSSPFPRDSEPISYQYHFDELFTTMGARLNANTASPAALMLIPGIDNDIAENIVKARAGEDGVDGTEDDTPFRSPMEVMTRGMTGMWMGGPGGAGGPPPQFPGGIPFGGGTPGQPPPNAMGPGGPMGAMAQRYLGVSSQYFEVTIDAEVAGYKRTYYAVLYRPPGKEPQIIKFYSN